MTITGRVKVCTSIYANEPELLVDLISKAFASGSDLVEIRTDYLSDLDEDKLEIAIGPNMDKCLLTCRPFSEGGQFKGDESKRIRWLLSLAEMRPAFVDLELRAALANPAYLSKFPNRDKGLIISWHDFRNTPAINELEKVLSKSRGLGSHVKIVVKATNAHDNFRILSLYNRIKKGTLIAFCMGEKGLVSRVLCPLVGSPFTYASLQNLPVADGQMPVNELREIYDLIRMDC